MVSLPFCVQRKSWSKSWSTVKQLKMIMLEKYEKTTFSYENVVFLSFSGAFRGGDEGDRTPYLLNAIQALSQVSYTPKRQEIYYHKLLDLSIGNLKISQNIFHFFGRRSRGAGKAASGTNRRRTGGALDIVGAKAGKVNRPLQARRWRR